MVSVQDLLEHCRNRTTIVFGNLGRWPAVLEWYDEYPYTLIVEPAFGVHVPRTWTGTVVVLTSHLDLTWDEGVEVRFFHVGRLSRDAWEHRTLGEGHRVDVSKAACRERVYTSVLQWVDTWEQHRDDRLPWWIQWPRGWWAGPHRVYERHLEKTRDTWRTVQLTSSNVEGREAVEYHYGLVGERGEIR